MVKLLKVSWATKQSLKLEFRTPVNGDLNALGYHIFFSESAAIPSTSTEGWAHRFLAINQTQKTSANASDEALNESFVSDRTVRTILDGMNTEQTYFVRIQIALPQDNSHELPSVNHSKKSEAPLSVIAVAPAISKYFTFY